MEGENLQSRSDISHDSNVQSSSKSKRGRINFITDKLLSALDKCKITDYNAMHLIMATAEALGVDTNTLVLNRTSLYERRKEFREKKFKEIKQTFHLGHISALVVHWDTKLLSELREHQASERLAVLVSFEGKVQLLNVPKLENATGKSQADTIFDILNEWGIANKVKALCCDTTASNTGHLKGACILLEHLLEKDLMYLPCRRHILELVLKAVFEAKLESTTTGPDVQLFKRFKDQWPTINPDVFVNGIEDEFVESIVRNSRENLLQFCSSFLQASLCRGDYKELLELTILFLGGSLTRKATFHYPGAFHHARWMAKAIYCLKIFMFRKQFHLRTEEEQKLRDICIFIVKVYVESWFRCPNAVAGPFNDFIFLKALADYPDPMISKVALKKFSNHLWYLAPETVALSLFDERVDTETKRKIVKKMGFNDNAEKGVKKYSLNLNHIKEIVSQDLSQFVTSESLNLFSRFEVSSEFLKLDPNKWETDTHYVQGLNAFSKLIVTNDVAERGVKLIQEYINILPKDDEQRQFLLHVVCEYRSKYPDSRKKTLQKST